MAVDRDLEDAEKYVPDDRLLDRDEVDYRESRRAQRLYQLRFRLAPECIINDARDRCIVGRLALADHRLLICPP